MCLLFDRTMHDAPLSRTSSQLERPRLLLVDDEPSVLRGLRRVLEANQPFWQIDLAKDGEEALALMAKFRYEVLITDLHMPRLGGSTLLLRASQAYPNTVRIVHSSRTETLDTSSFARLAHRILPKPAAAIEILEATRWALAKAAPSHSACA